MRQFVLLILVCHTIATTHVFHKKEDHPEEEDFKREATNIAREMQNPVEENEPQPQVKP